MNQVHQVSLALEAILELWVSLGQLARQVIQEKLDLREHASIVLLQDSLQAIEAEKILKQSTITISRFFLIKVFILFVKIC